MHSLSRISAKFVDLKKKMLAFLIIAILPMQLLAEKPYVILIGLDGFRWDYTDRGISPTLEMIREEGATALSLHPTFPSKTFPNHLSIVTGMHPENHGIVTNGIRDPFTDTRYRMGNNDAIRESRWYLGEMFWETAERQGITTASYFWPGSELPEDHRRPTYQEFYEHERPYETRIEGLLEWLKKPEEERPHFMTLYFHEVDSKGHQFGPDSPEVNEAIKLVDGLLAKLLDGLEEIGMHDKTNLIIVSDHGMTEVSTDRAIDIQATRLADYTCIYYGNGPFLLIRPEDPEQTTEIMARLNENPEHYTVYHRDDFPSRYHFSNHPFIPPIIVMADLGWSVFDSRMLARVKRRPGAGNHGYDNFHTDMHGLFYAYGPAFREGYRTGTVNTIDIYPLLCRIFDIMPRQNIDGSLERIEAILK